jgi:(p)ppGpp synthase/HD superfamily hydrolase
LASLQLFGGALPVKQVNANTAGLLEFKMSIVDQAQLFARKAHGNQKRRDGLTPYFKHPESLVELLRTWGVTNENILSAAYLHDVLENCTTTEDELEEAFGKEICQLVVNLSHLPNEDYSTYIKRIAGTSSVVIKLSDIVMNLSDDPTTKQIKKYSEALKVLIPLILNKEV